MRELGSAFFEVAVGSIMGLEITFLTQSHVAHYNLENFPQTGKKAEKLRTQTMIITLTTVLLVVAADGLNFRHKYYDTSLINVLSLVGCYFLRLYHRMTRIYALPQEEHILMVL